MYQKVCQLLNRDNLLSWTPISDDKIVNVDSDRFQDMLGDCLRSLLSEIIPDYSFELIQCIMSEDDLMDWHKTSNKQIVTKSLLSSLYDYCDPSILHPNLVKYTIEKSEQRVRVTKRSFLGYDHIIWVRLGTYHWRFILLQANISEDTPIVVV